MRKEMYKSTVFPTSTQLLFLKAILSNEKDFASRLLEWKNCAGNYTELDESTLQLFPLLYKKIIDLEQSDPLLQVATNSYRHHWLRNSLLLHAAVRASQVLAKNHIPSMVLKGGAWLYLYYGGDIGLRKLEDIDIFIPQQHFPKAVTALKHAGWSAHPQNSDTYFDPRFFHAVSIKHDNASIDLHCHVLHAYLNDNDWELFSEQAQRFSMNNLSALTLGDSDHLVHACAHGLRWSGSNTLRWIVDIVNILQRGDIHWDRVVKVAKQTDTALSTVTALTYVRDEFSIKIPAQVIHELQGHPTTLSTRRLYLLVMKNTMNNPFAALETYWWRYYKSLQHPISVNQIIANASGYLRFLCNTSHTIKVPHIVAVKFGQLLLRSATRYLHLA
ncbi:MAG: nucleotidyltransferase family protein [Candidatus Andersenbacteria bacterium]